MWSTARDIAAGDMVIVWMSRDQLQPLIITPGKDYNNRYGNYRHSDLIGIPFGSKVGSWTGKGFIHVLRPTPELWTMALPHRTQILYLADISFITSHLDIRPGSKVIEAGTGSASFSHSTIRTIGSTGHLWSYEFHEARANKAREEFARHGFTDTVTLTHRNVCKDGFTVTDTADALFLDIPSPWEAIEHAKNALRKDRTTRICCFSPCMEQVLRTVSALNDAGFTEITMYETLIKPHEIVQIPALQPISQVSEKLKKAENKREDKRLQQIATGRTRSGSKRKREEEEDEEAEKDPSETDATKRVKTEGDETVAEKEETFAAVPEAEILDEVTEDSVKLSLSKGLSEVRGHTSYLTFASLTPSHPSLSTDDMVVDTT
ncbi:tRNA methyltransferase complex subunit Cpd1 [Mycena floridula]|nr:tRNA methyltransferase complex subunit Cpd1 [Mycena floridula]